MHKELELWQFILPRLQNDESVLLLVVGESSGSSPGRRGYKMAVGSDDELIGSIGGGVMEVKLVEESKRLLENTSATPGGSWEQVHRRDVENSSGMICSGRQSVIYFRLSPADASNIDAIVEALRFGNNVEIQITKSDLHVSAKVSPLADKILYSETIGFANRLYIVGGGHCALALSELMSRMDFHITLFDDRPDLNTIAKNNFAHEIKIVDSYERIGDHISSGVNAFVVVMTLGYRTDEIVIRSLVDKEFKYFGVLGSKAKMSSMLRDLRQSGISPDKLQIIHTPVGLPINSRTPEEIAVSIAAEIISVKNGPV